MQKIAPKRQTTLKNAREKKISTPVKKISTDGIHRVRRFFHLCLGYEGQRLLSEPMAQAALKKFDNMKSIFFNALKIKRKELILTLNLDCF